MSEDTRSAEDQETTRRFLEEILMGLVKANLPGNEELISTIEEALTASRQHHIDKP